VNTDFGLAMMIPSFKEGIIINCIINVKWYKPAPSLAIEWQSIGNRKPIEWQPIPITVSKAVSNQYQAQFQKHHTYHAKRASAFCGVESMGIETGGKQAGHRGGYRRR